MHVSPMRLFILPHLPWKVLLFLLNHPIFLLKRQKTAIFVDFYPFKQENNTIQQKKQHFSTKFGYSTQRGEQKMIWDLLKTNYKFSNYEIRLVRYSLLAIFSELSKFLILFFIFSMLKRELAFVTAVIVLLILRSNMGGIHFKHYLSCLFFTFMFFSFPSSFFLTYCHLILIQYYLL